MKNNPQPNEQTRPDGGRQTLGYVLKLTVRNVRCFGDEPQTLCLADSQGRPAQWTLLLGDNGTGKTTLLQSLAVMLNASSDVWPPQQPNIEENRAAVDRPGSCLFAFRRYGPLEGPWRPCRAVDKPMHIEAELSSLTSFSITNQPQSSSSRVLDYDWNGILKFSSSISILDINCFGYGPSRRLSISTVMEIDTDDSRATLFSENADLRNAEEWLLRVDYSASKPSKIQDRQRAQLERVKKILCDLLPDVDEVRITEPTEQAPTPAVQFKTPYGWVPLQELGHGYKSMIAWVVDFASRLVDHFPDSADPLAEPAIVLIDEIDLHLHPTWQRKIMDHLTKRFPNTQFIASAHSPLVVQAAQDANLVLLKRDGDHVVIQNDVKSIRGWRIDQILTSDLYDLPTARPPQFEEKLERRKDLLTKPSLTKEDKRELARLEAEIGDLPLGDTADEAQKLQSVVDRTRELLEKYRD